MMNFLLDQGLPRSTVTYLKNIGLNAQHVGQLGMATALDKEILDKARQDNFIVVTPSQSWPTFLHNHVCELVSSEILPKPISGFKAFLTWVVGAVKRWLAGNFHNPLSLQAAPAWHIVNEPISCQSKPRLRHQKVIVLVGFSSRGPPSVKPLFNESAPFGTRVAVWCPVTIGYTPRVRWGEVTKTIYRRRHPHDKELKDRRTIPMHHVRNRSDRLAA